MRKLISTIFTLTIILTAQSVWAQKEKTDARAERRTMIEELAEMKKAQTNAANAQPTLNIGDAESFGKNVKFLGNASTGAVYVYRSCDPAILLAELDLTLAPEDRCVAHTGGATTAATFDDLGSITLPGKSADNLIYYLINSTVANNYENFTPVPLFTSFTYAPRLTIESAALNDPAAVDPSTGLPLNGVLTLSANAGRFETRTIQPNASESYVDTSTRAASRGLSRSLFADLGLPPQVIDKLYRQPMTIKFGMRVTVRNVFFGQYFYAVRLMGN
jgi:hypothetical protein